MITAATNNNEQQQTINNDKEKNSSKYIQMQHCICKCRMQRSVPTSRARTLLGILSLAFAAAAPTVTQHHLRYFSVWGLETISNPKDITPWSNFLFTGTSAETAIQFHKQAGVRSLLNVEHIFVCGNSLCHDYKSKWASILNQTVRPLLQSGVLFGIFFGDEVRHMCASTLE